MKRSPSSVMSTSSVLGARRLSRLSMKSQSRTELKSCRDSQQTGLVIANSNAQAEWLRFCWLPCGQCPQSAHPHGAFGAELFPWFLRLCQPPVRVSVTVKAFASKWTCPSALLKVFTSFFPEKQKRIMSKPGCRQTTPRHLCWSRVSLPSEVVTGRLRDAASRSPRWTVEHHSAESHAHGVPRWPPGLTTPPAQLVRLRRVPALAPPGEAPALPASSDVKVTTGAWTWAAALRVSFQSPLVPPSTLCHRPLLRTVFAYKMQSES